MVFFVYIIWYYYLLLFVYYLLLFDIICILFVIICILFGIIICYYYLSSLFIIINWNLFVYQLFVIIIVICYWLILLFVYYLLYYYLYIICYIIICILFVFYFLCFSDCSKGGKNATLDKIFTKSDKKKINFKEISFFKKNFFFCFASEINFVDKKIFHSNHLIITKLLWRLLLFIWLKLLLSLRYFLLFKLSVIIKTRLSFWPP